MFRVNKYDITATVPNAAAGAVVNVNPNVVTGATGDSAGASSVTPITTTAVFSEQVISKLLALTIPLGGLLDAQINYITVDLVKLGITGTRPILAATLLGIYNPASTEQAGAGATPSFIGMCDKTVANINSLSVVNSKLILQIPAAQRLLFANKIAMIQLYYSASSSQ